MKVRTLKPHGNAYPPQYQKNRGRIYDATDRDAANLISSGRVEEVKEAAGEDETDSGDSGDADAGSD